MDIRNGSAITEKEKQKLGEKARQLTKKIDAKNAGKGDVFHLPKDVLKKSWLENLPNAPGKYFAGYRELKNSKFRLALK